MVHIGRGRRDGLGRVAHDRRDDPARVRDHRSAREGVSVVSSVFLMCLADRVLVYGDCAVNPKPDPEQLADIAISSVGDRGRVRDRAEDRDALLFDGRVRQGRGRRCRAPRRRRPCAARRPDLKVEGPIQYDAAVDAAVAKLKLPESDVAGQRDRVRLPRPRDRERRLQGRPAVGERRGDRAGAPGARKPVNDLSRGCTVTDIVNTVAITAIQARGAE